MLAIVIKIPNTDGSEMLKERIPVSSSAIRLIYYTIVLIKSKHKDILIYADISTLNKLDNDFLW